MVCVKEFGVLFVEDDLYGEFSYIGDVLFLLCLFNLDGVIYMGLFLKILVLGMCLGYIIVFEYIYFKFV